MKAKVLPVGPSQNWKNLSTRVSPEGKKILHMGKLQFDMSFDEIVDSSLREWARRHGLDKFLATLPPAGTIRGPERAPERVKNSSAPISQVPESVLHSSEQHQVSEEHPDQDMD